MNHIFRTMVVVCAIAVVSAIMPTPFQAQSFVATPLICPGGSGDPYLGQFQLGLYEKDSNAMPTDHSLDGIAAAANVLPINGVIGVLGIGMSNAMYEWSYFAAYLPLQMTLGPSIRLLTGADSGRVACTWSVAYGGVLCNGFNSPNQYDRVRDAVLTPAGLAESQVEVIWIDDADPQPTLSLPASNADAYALEAYFGDVARAARQRYPNLKLMFVDSRVYGGYATVDLNPEPYAYESGFSVKWLIQAQVNQMRTGQIDPVAGDLDYRAGAAPWLAWAPYEWADGTQPRCRDKLTWLQTDFRSDGTHLDGAGQKRWSTTQLSWWKTSLFTRWLVK